MKSGTLLKAEKELVTLWLPKRLALALNAVVERQDTDRSKFVRAAVREKLQRLGIKEAA